MFLYPSALLKDFEIPHLDINVKPDRKNIFFRCVEDSNEAIMITDAKGLLIYVNPAWSHIYGYTREEALGKSPRILHSGLQAPDFYQDMWARICNPEIGHWKGELINKSKDGGLVPVLLTITPFRDTSGSISGFMGMVVDLSYKRELEAKIAHQDRLASIGILASGLAHEIGTPLGVIRGRAEYLIMKTKDQLFKNNLETITIQTDRISKLIRSLLRVSRSFSEVDLREVAVRAVIDEVLALIGQNFKKDEVELKIEIPNDLKISADFGRLEQVLLNLLMNSVHAICKAKDSGQAGPHFLKIFYEKTEHNTVILHVEDSGCGMSAEHLKKIFRPFFTTKDVGEGTGLGLAITAQLMNEMRGRISVQSIFQKGSVFSLEFQTKAF